MNHREDLPPVVLASASPRRLELLRAAAVRVVEVVAADIDERPWPDEGPEDLVLRLAVEKAKAIAPQYAGHLVVAADTIVCSDGQVLGKPEDLREAREMLAQLSGRRHQVLTAVCVQRLQPGFDKSWVSSTEVCFNALGKGDIDFIIEHRNPLDKAGAYGIQEDEARLVAEFSGLKSTVIGLPIEELLPVLQAAGVTNS